jgi:putative flippase GtrA
LRSPSRGRIPKAACGPARSPLKGGTADADPGAVTIEATTARPAALVVRRFEVPGPRRLPAPPRARGIASPQGVRYMSVATSGYGVNLALFAALGAVLPYRAAFALAFAAAATATFLVHRRFTFGAAGCLLRQSPRFVAVTLLTLGVQLVLLTAMVELAGMPRVGAAVCSAMLATPVAFAANRRWSFGAPARLG